MVLPDFCLLKCGSRIWSSWPPLIYAIIQTYWKESLGRPRKKCMSDLRSRKGRKPNALITRRRNVYRLG
jgi:hypothetical protein